MRPEYVSIGVFHTSGYFENQDDFHKFSDVYANNQTDYSRLAG